MKVRLSGTAKEFAKLEIEKLDRNKFLSFRKPQKGGNPKYQPGGVKFDPKIGEVELMYLELDIEVLSKLFETLKLKSNKGIKSKSL